MAQIDTTARAIAGRRSIAERLRSVRQTIIAVAVVALLWSTDAAAQAVPANCPANLATANIINHNFGVSFCELCGVGTVRLEIENPYRRQDDVDFSDIIVTEEAKIRLNKVLPDVKVVEPETDTGSTEETPKLKLPGIKSIKTAG